MRNTKLWSVLLAAVLLCACVVGVLFVGTQAEGTAYYMTVGDADGAYADKVSDKNFVANYDGVGAAVKAAATRTWAAGDTLTIYVASSDSAAPTYTTSTADRQLYSTYTIFRGDNTKLPIEINGDDPSTEAVEKPAIPMGAFGYKLDGVQVAQAANDFTFKNLDLTSWVQTTGRLYAGSGVVTFDNVILGSGYADEILYLAPQLVSQTALTGWNSAKWDANVGEGGLLDCAIVLKNTSYGSANAGGSYQGTLVAGVTENGLGKDGTSSTYTGDKVIYQTDLRNKIVIGEGATVSGIYHYATQSKGVSLDVTGNLAPAERVIEIDGGSVGTVYSIRGNITSSAANKLVVNMKSGTLNNLQMGNISSDATYTGDLVVNWTGGTITTLKTLTAGTVNGNVYCNIANQNFASFTSNKIGINGTITGTLYTTLEDVTVTGNFDMSNVGGTVSNFDNTLKGTINLTGDDHSYISAGGKAVTGNITNHIYADVNVTKASSVTSNYLYGGLNGQTCSGKITNYIYDGADIDCVFVAGSNGSEGGTNGVMTGGVETVVYGGNIDYLYCGGSRNNSTAVSSVKTTVLGGTITNYYGFTGEGSSSVNKARATKVENVLGKVNEDGTYSGDGHIINFWGGSYVEGSLIGEIENTFYSGKIGAADRTSKTANNKLEWFNSYVATAGSKIGEVGKITNTFYGGTFNCSWFYAGNNGAASFTDTLYTLKEGESQINSTVYGGHFARFAGGSGSGVVDSVSTTVAGSSVRAISVRSYAFYCGEGASAATVYNTLSGFAPVTVGDDGVVDSDSSGMYGGGNSSTPTAINNTIKNAAVVDSFYAGSNGAKAATSYITLITKDADSEVAPVIDTFFGGNSTYNDNSVNTASITNTVEAGMITNYRGGHNSVTVAGEIGTITNNFTGGEVKQFVSGCYTFKAPAATATEDMAFNIGNIVNNIGSKTAENMPVVTGNFFGGVYDNVNSNASKVAGRFYIANIENIIDYAIFGNNSYLGTRYHVVENITNEINNLDISDATIILGSNVGTLNGTVATTINGLAAKNIVADVNSSSCVVADDAQFILTIAEGAKIYVTNASSLNLGGNFPSKGTHTVNATSFDLIQTEYWRDGQEYLIGASAAANIIDNVYGEAVVIGDKVVGQSTLKKVSANMILTERVAIRIVFDKDVAKEYAVEDLVALVGGKNVKIEIDPENENAIIIYGIGVKDFAGEISFAGLLPALDASQNSIVKLADSAAETSDIYKAIADFGRVAAGGEATYGLKWYATSKVSSKNAEPDASKLAITGKNLIMSDALGFRYYGTLVGETTIEDIKVYVEGSDYTTSCNIAVVNEENGAITIDFYLPIGIMSAPIDVQITAGETVALDYVDYGDAICQKILNAQPENALAKAAMVYIQSAAKLSNGGAN